MEPRFTRGEYWLLTSVVEYELALCELISDELEVRLNTTGHGLTREVLVDTLHRLISGGLIYAKNQVTGFISTPEQIESALDETVVTAADTMRITLYGLTPEGGAQWEAFAAPDWDAYIEEGYIMQDIPDEYIGELICANKNWLEYRLESVRFRDYDYDIVEEPIQWDYVKPWQATYWKVLDGGYRVRFRCRDKSEEIFRPPPSREYFQKVWCAWR